MTEAEREIASFLYMARELQMVMDRDDYLYTLQGLIDTGDIWRYDTTIFHRVTMLFNTGELPYEGPEESIVTTTFN